MTDDTTDEQRTVHQALTFAIVPDWVIFHPELSDGAVRCYGVLARYSNKEHRLWPSQQQIADDMGRKLRAVQGYMSELKAAGAISVEQRRWNGSSILRIAVERPAQLCVTDPQKSAQQTRMNLRTNESQERDPLNESQSLALVEKIDETPKARKRDLLFENVATACGIEWDKLTPSARGSLNKAVSEIRAAGGEPQDVEGRALEYKRRFSQAPLTPPALAKHWPGLGQQTLATTNVSPLRLGLAQRKAARREQG